MIGPNINVAPIHPANVQSHASSLLGSQSNSLIHNHAHALGSQQLLGNNNISHISQAIPPKQLTPQPYTTSFPSQIMGIPVNQSSVSSTSNASIALGGSVSTASQSISNQNVFSHLLSSSPLQLNTNNLENYHIFSQFLKYLQYVPNSASFYFIPLYNGNTLIDLLPQVF